VEKRDEAESQRERNEMNHACRQQFPENRFDERCDSWLTDPPEAE